LFLFPGFSGEAAAGLRAAGPEDDALEVRPDALFLLVLDPSTLPPAGLLDKAGCPFGTGPGDSDLQGTTPEEIFNLSGGNQSNLLVHNSVI
jgi:hypothetical protein